MREFDFYFLPQEIGDLSDVIVPVSMIVVCKELADKNTLTLFNLDQALQYRSFGGVYFRDDLESIPQKQLSGSDGRKFSLVDDLALPEHLGLFAHRSTPPSLPRVSISLASGFSKDSILTPASPKVAGVFMSMKTALKARSRPFKIKGLETLVSNAAREAIVRGEASTGDAALDDLAVKN